MIPNPKMISKNTADISNKQFNDWTVLYYTGNSKWLCRCSCGVKREVRYSDLINNKSKSCGHDKLSDIKNKTFGNLKVIEYMGNKQWKCQCSCGRYIETTAYKLKNGMRKTCGHRDNVDKCIKTNKFGEWTVLTHIGNGLLKCKCSCGYIGNVSAYDLINYKSTSCGHKLINNKLTEDEIMKSLGYLKIYDSGNISMEWIKD